MFVRGLLAVLLAYWALAMQGTAARAQPAAPAAAQAVALSGILGNKALLVVEGSEPKLVSPGDSFRGVKVVSAQGDSAVLEIGGQRQTMRVGGAPVSVGTPVASGTGSRIVLSAGTGGHFVTQGLINSRPVQFLVDTGATTIGIGVADADRIGLSYKQGQAVQLTTANGLTRGWLVKLASVRLNDVEVHDIDAVVSAAAMPYVLLGNSYLSRFQMTRTNEQMVLEKRF